MKPAEGFAALGLLCALLSCSKDNSVAGSLSCNDMSAERWCASQEPDTCDLTWSAALTDTTLCGYYTGAGGVRYYVFDCPGYHVLYGVTVDVATTFLYDATSGALVAIVNTNNAGETCVGPSAGFVLPAGCDALNAAPPPQCLADGGAEGGSPG
jgi:hypothetical protein